MATRTRDGATSRSKRDDILKEAERHFAIAGFSGGSLSAIARDVGIGNPSLLHHFPSKEALYRAVLERIADDLTSVVADHLRNEVDPLERLHAFMRAQLAWIKDRPPAFILIQRELLDNTERVRSARRFPLRPYLEAAIDVISRAADASLIKRDVPPVAILCILLGSISYAHNVLPTFAESLKLTTLQQRGSWLDLIGTSVLRLLEETPARTPPTTNRGRAPRAAHED